MGTRKDLDSIAKSIYEDLEAHGDTLNQETLLLIKGSMLNDYECVKHYCSNEYKDLIQKIILRVDKILSDKG